MTLDDFISLQKPAAEVHGVIKLKSFLVEFHINFRIGRSIPIFLLDQPERIKSNCTNFLVNDILTE